MLSPVKDRTKFSDLPKNGKEDRWYANQRITFKVRSDKLEDLEPTLTKQVDIRVYLERYEEGKPATTYPMTFVIIETNEDKPGKLKISATVPKVKEKGWYAIKIKLPNPWTFGKTYRTVAQTNSIKNSMRYDSVDRVYVMHRESSKLTNGHSSTMTLTETGFVLPQPRMSKSGPSFSQSSEFHLSQL